jgi:hypothetical protein
MRHAARLVARCAAGDSASTHPWQRLAAPLFATKAGGRRDWATVALERAALALQERNQEGEPGDELSELGPAFVGDSDTAPLLPALGRPKPRRRGSTRGESAAEEAAFARVPPPVQSFLAWPPPAAAVALHPELQAAVSVHRTAYALLVSRTVLRWCHHSFSPVACAQNAGGAGSQRRGVVGCGPCRPRAGSCQSLCTARGSTPVKAGAADGSSGADEDNLEHVLQGESGFRHSHNSSRFDSLSSPSCTAA